MSRAPCGQCGRSLIMLPDSFDGRPVCGQCRNVQDACDCPRLEIPNEEGREVLPELSVLLKELTTLAERKADKPRVHGVIRLLAHAAPQTQQEYRDAITAAGHIGRGDWREALSAAKKQAESERMHQLASQQGAGIPTRPQHPDAIDITEEPQAVHAITNAINDGRFAEVFVRGDVLAAITTGEKGVIARELTDAILRRLIADNLPCEKLMPFGFVGALPHPMTCKAILALPQWPKVRRLRGVASFPVPLADGTIIQQPGYHAGSGLFLPEGMGVPPVPDHPSSAQVKTSRDFILDKFLADFPWISPADKANAFAMLLTPLLREIVSDVYPFCYITAPERGSGKTLLAELVNMVYNPGADLRVLPADEKEIEKTITSALRGAAPVIVFDNVTQTIKSPSLAAVLTMRNWTARILGGSRDGTYPNDRLWICTGTNISLGGDFAQRSMRIAMDYGKPNPDLRTRFAIPDIKKWTAGHREQVLWYLLILVRAWQLDGAQPDTRHVMRGFTPWAQAVGAVLAFHKIDGFLANRDEVIGHDEDDAEMAVFLHMLRSRFPGTRCTAKQILSAVAAEGQLSDALPSTLDGGKWTPKSLGKFMGGHEGKWYGQKPRLTLRRTQDSSRLSWWRVEAWTE